MEEIYKGEYGEKYSEGNTTEEIQGRNTTGEREKYNRGRNTRRKIQRREIRGRKHDQKNELGGKRL